MAADAYSSTLNGYILEPSLPDEVLAVLPTDTYLQLDLAYKITCHAYSQQVSRLEREGQEMQSTISQNQQVIKSLERRVAGMEAEMQDHQQRTRQSMAEQHKLAAEKNALIETVKRLNREVAKLEHFKRNLLQQLQDEDEDETDGAGVLAPSMAAVDVTTERLVSDVLQSANGIAAVAAANQQQQQAQFGQQQQQQQRYTQAQQSNRLSPPRGSHPGTFGTAGLGPNRKHGSPNSPNNNMARVTQTPAWQQLHQQNSHFPIKASGVPSSAPTSPYRQRPSPPSPPKRSGAGAPGALNAAAGAAANMGQLGASGRFAASAGGAATTPTKATAAAAGGGGGLGAAAAGRAAAAGGGGSSGGGAACGVSMTSPRIDGKEFFRQARARLSYEQFSQFLVAIKDLNAGRVSREDTLAAAQQLFGPANIDLYGMFEGLLLRHLTSL